MIEIKPVVTKAPKFENRDKKVLLVLFDLLDNSVLGEKIKIKESLV